MTVAGEAQVTPREELLPPVALSGGPLGDVQAAEREISRQTALRARAVAEFAAARPASSDRAQGEPGAMSPERWAARPELLRPVSEFAVQELVIALSISAGAAERLLERSLALVHRLPRTLAALEAGALHVGHLWPLIERLAPVESDEIRAQTEAALLEWMSGRVTTPAQLGAKLTRELLRRDARAAARRLAEAVTRERGVDWRPGRVEGMGEVTAALTLPESRALIAALGAYADAVDDEYGEPQRTRGQKMADCLLELVLRPGGSDLPPVQVVLSLVASLPTVLGGDEPGEVDGQVVPAEMVRRLLRALTGADLTSDDRPAPAPGDAHGADRPGAMAGDDPSSGTQAEVAQDEAHPAEVDGLPWDLVEEREFLRWAAETQARIIAGDYDEAAVDDEPPEVWLERFRDDDATAAARSCPSPEDRAPELVDRGDGGPRPLDTTDDPVPPGPADFRPGSGAGSPWALAARDRGGPICGAVPRSAVQWWTDADRAIAIASSALRGFHEAMAHARRLVGTAVAADAADEASWAGGRAGRIDRAGDALAALAEASHAQRAQLTALMDTTGGGGLSERPRLVLVDALTGALRGLTDLRGLRRAAHCGRPSCARRPTSCRHDLGARPGLGPPEPTEGYRPGAALDRWVRARDRRCRFPGCRRSLPRQGELDHVRRHPEGPTAATNLAGFCGTDHRAKHQAPGWQHELHPDGTLTVTTPTGLVATTAPPPF